MGKDGGGVGTFGIYLNACMIFCLYAVVPGSRPKMVCNICAKDFSFFREYIRDWSRWAFRMMRMGEMGIFKITFVEPLHIEIP